MRHTFRDPVLRRMAAIAMLFDADMTLVCPDAGEVVLANNYLNKVAPQNQTLKLYKNNITPAETDTAATYTEAAFSGYAAKALTGADWTVTSGAPTTAAAPIQTFTANAVVSESIYGYFMVQATSGTIMTAERFTGAPFAMANNGDSISVTPQITFD
jgi:hypothetical protein